MIAVGFVFLLASYILPSARALQVTPNSACAQMCTDDPSPDVSNPSGANISGSDIICKDDDYPGSATGQRFENCINCLQNSTAVDAGESDQAWFLYNLRFALNACLFDTANATDPISTSCSTDAVCGPLEDALQHGMQNISTIQEFSYCSADDNSFVGSFLSTCTSCLRASNNLVYLANFLVALDAGCVQQPPPGFLIGVNSTLFSNNTVTITYPMSSPLQNSTPRKPLSKGDIIGISVACGVAFLMIITVALIWTRSHLNAKRLKKLQSPLDARFGAPNISAPHSNAYASAESPPLVKEAIPLTGSPPMINFSRQASPRTRDTGDQQIPTYSPPLFGASIPTHHAYQPYTPRSRNSTSPRYGSLPPSIPRQPSAPYPEHPLPPASNAFMWTAATPPPPGSPPPVPPPPSVGSPPRVPSPASNPSPSAAPQPSPAASTPSSSSTFSLSRILHRSSQSSGEPFLPRFPLSQRSFGRGHTGSRRDARSSFRISGPVMNAGSGLGLQVPAESNRRANNRNSTDSDPLW